MDPDLLYSVMAIVLGLGLSAVFSGAEVAFFSLGSTTGAGSAPADPALGRVYRMLDAPRRLLATILIGNTFANIITAVVAATLARKWLSALAVPDVVVYVLEVAVITFVILIISEITPKIIALKNPVDVARRLGFILYPVFILLAPVSILIAEFTKWMESRLPQPTSAFSADDLKMIAEVGQDQGSLKEDEREIIENMIEFGNTTVKEIMTSRVDIVALSDTDSLGEALELVRDESVSRLPLYGKDLDEIHGVIHTKDLLAFLDQPPTTIPKWTTLARPALFIPATKRLDDLLRDFQAQKTHLAIVVDEYGGTEGIVSLDDVLEEIIGDLGADDDSPEEVMYTLRKNGEYVFDAKINLDDMGDVLGVELASDDDEFETLGGLVYHLLERIPNVGEEVTYKGHWLHIHTIEKNRVTRVRVRKLP